MQKLLRAIAFESFALYILSQLFAGVVLKDGIQGIIISGAAIAVASFLLKPILKVFTAPFAWLTFGLASIISDGIILFIVTRFVKQLVIVAFTWPGLNIMGIILPRMHFNLFFAFLVVAASQFVIKWFLIWLT